MNWIRKHRGAVLQCIDLSLWALGTAGALFLTEAMTLWRMQVFLVVLAVHVLVYQIGSMYQVIWRYAGIRQFAKCIVCEAVTFLLLDVGAGMFFHWRINRFCVVAVLLTGFLMVSSRFGYVLLISWRMGGVRSRNSGARTLIIGAGEAASILLADMRRDPECHYQPVGLLDDDTAKCGRKLWNVKVYGPVNDIARFTKQLSAQLIVFAIFDISEDRKREILSLCANTGVKVMMAPSLRELQEVGEGVSRGISFRADG